MKTNNAAKITMAGLWFQLDAIKAMAPGARQNAVNALKARIVAERFAHPHLARWFDQAESA